MRIVVALGGNALLRRDESPDADIQESHVVTAASGLTPLLRHHELIITHGSPGRRPRDVPPGQVRRPPLRRAHRQAAGGFPAGSMGPKVEAACRFAEATGRTAAIGRLDDAAALLAGTAGTVVTP